MLRGSRFMMLTLVLGAFSTSRWVGASRGIARASQGITTFGRQVLRVSSILPVQIKGQDTAYLGLTYGGTMAPASPNKIRAISTTRPFSLCGRVFTHLDVAR